MKKMLTLAAFAAALLVAPASAQPGSTPSPTQTVSYADLDLSRSSDVERLDRRIARAAQAACGPVSSSDPRGKIEARRCRAQAQQAAALQRDRAIASAEQAPSTVLASGQ